MVLIALVMGCGKRESHISNPKYEKLLDASVQELELKTTACQSWGMGKFKSWNLNQDDGNLVFSNSNGTSAICPAQIIGTYDSTSKTWLWAWANPSVADKLKSDALKVKAYGEANHIERLTKAEWPCNESDAWAMTALAVKLASAQGAYRGPAGSTYIFISFGKVKLSNAK